MHALLLKAIDQAFGFSDMSKEVVLGAFQQYLRNQNMFCFWNMVADKMEPMFSNNNYHPKSTVIENAVFAGMGRGNWASCRANTIEAMEWNLRPWELVSNARLIEEDSELASLVSGKSEKVQPRDPVLPFVEIACASSTDLSSLPNGSYDLAITDPPFGGLLHYAGLADFFYVWLRLYLGVTVHGPAYWPTVLVLASKPIFSYRVGHGTDHGHDTGSAVLSRYRFDRAAARREPRLGT